MWKNFSKKWFKTHIEREQENESNSSVLEKPKIDIVNNNNRTLLFGPSLSGETHLM